MPSPTLIPLTDRFSLSIDGLWRAVAAMFAGGRLQATMIGLIVCRIRRIETRVLALVAAIRSGRVRGGWVIEARAARAPGASQVAPPASLKLPRSFAWLLVLVPYHAAGYASQLRYLLADPEMAAMLAATPRLGKLLRPLCRMLGIEAELLVPVVPVVVPVAVTVVDEGVAAVSAAQAEGLGCVVKRSVPSAVPEDGPDAGAWFYRLG